MSCNAREAINELRTESATEAQSAGWETQAGRMTSAYERLLVWVRPDVTVDEHQRDVILTTVAYAASEKMKSSEVLQRMESLAVVINSLR